MSTYKTLFLLIMFTPLCVFAERRATVGQIHQWCRGEGGENLRVTNMTKAEACRFYGYAPYENTPLTPVRQESPNADPLQGDNVASPNTSEAAGSLPTVRDPEYTPTASGENPCQSPELTSLIPQGTNQPPRFPRAQNEYLNYAETQIRNGNIPEHIRGLVPVSMDQGAHSCLGSSEPITLCAMPEPISIGPSNNYSYSPIRYSQAHQIARDFGMIIPTEAMVNATLQTPGNTHVAPRPRPWYSGNGGDGTMTQPYRFREQSDSIRSDLGPFGTGNLIVGTHKDYILRNGVGMSNGTFNQLALYGWHRSREPGSRWQPAGIQHGDNHVDYSQTPRFYSQWAVVNGRWENLTSLLQDPECARTLNGGSPISSSIAEAFSNTESRPPSSASGEPEREEAPAQSSDVEL